MDKDAKIFVAGHRGMVGSGVVRIFQQQGYNNLLLKNRQELDLTDKQAVGDFFQQEKPEYVIMAAAKVGGIEANRRHNAEFLLENLEIQNNVIYQSYLNGVKKFCFLGSSCIYPCQCPQPIKEEYLLSGPLEPTNEGYALAKISGYKLCYHLSKQYGFNTISLMPCNLYGTNDNYDPVNSHVFPALVRRFVDIVDDGGKEITLWGTGIAKREFLHVDDLAGALLRLMLEWNDPTFVNVGAGSDISIYDLAYKIAAAAGFQGEIKWDSSKPDGMLRKCMDTTKINNMGWKPEISLDAGIKRTINEYRELKYKGLIRQ